MAQIATFGTMVRKWFYGTLHVFSGCPRVKRIVGRRCPQQAKNYVRRSIPRVKTDARIGQFSPNNQLLYKTAVQLEGLPRHVSTRSVVISDENLLNLVPLQPGSNEILLTQFTMNDVEKIGLLKMDFLGLRNLSIIDDTLTAVKRVYNRTIRLNQIPLDDETTLALFRKGETSGVFQFESAGIRNVLRKLGQLALKILLLSMPCIVLVRCKILMFSSAGKRLGTN